jgi:hypothetical protein
VPMAAACYGSRNNGRTRRPNRASASAPAAACYGSRNNGRTRRPNRASASAPAAACYGSRNKRVAEGRSER